MQEILVHFVLQKEAGAFGNNIGKESKKPRPKLKNMDVIYLLRTSALPAIQCKWQSFTSGSLLQTCINLVEQRLKFEGSIIP